MRHPVVLLVAGIVAVALVTCGAGTHLASAQPHQPPAAPATGTTGKVVETMNAGEYTYVLVDDGSKKIWAAAPRFAVAVGNTVVVPDGMPMQKFHSQTLRRTFDLIYFVPGVQVVEGQAAKDPVVPAHGTGWHGAAGYGAAGRGAGGTPPAPAVDPSNIQKADGGATVAELYAGRAALAGKEVVVRGRVVKFTPAVMGKNWLHLQDGTGGTGTNDLPVSTSASAAVGRTVLVRGKLTTDKDFGSGYHYDIIIEDATVAVE